MEGIVGRQRCRPQDKSVYGVFDSLFVLRLVDDEPSGGATSSWYV
jgi:hypothetical protein